MKAFLILLLLLFAVSATAEIEQPYLVVVGHDAPASDVVLAANFAAYMKETLGVTFSSALDSDLTNPDFDGKTVVVIDGQNRIVKIIGTSNAAAAANLYFTQQGFRVQEIQYPKKEDVQVRPNVIKETIVNATSAVNTTNAIINTTRNAQQVVNTVVEKIENKTNDSTPQVPQVEPPKPNFIQKIFSWFAHLF